MDAIEPYDYSDLRPFSSAYLPGFLADKYDVNQQESLPRIQSRAENSAEMEMRNTVQGYSTVTATSKNLNFSHSGMKYALMPVWMLSTKWKPLRYEIRADAGLDAQHEMEGSEFPLCHEWPDWKAGRRPSHR